MEKNDFGGKIIDRWAKAASSKIVCPKCGSKNLVISYFGDVGNDLCCKDCRSIFTGFWNDLMGAIQAEFEKIEDKTEISDYQELKQMFSLEDGSFWRESD